MCNAFTKRNKRCSLAPKKQYCHIHTKSHHDKPSHQLIDMLQSQRTSLLQSFQITIIERELALELTEKHLEEVKSKLKQAQMQIKLMKVDYNAYQIVKQYERSRAELVKQKVDLSQYNNNQYHELRKRRNYLVHEKVLVI